MSRHATPPSLRLQRAALAVKDAGDELASLIAEAELDVAARMAAAFAVERHALANMASVFLRASELWSEGEPGLISERGVSATELARSVARSVRGAISGAELSIDYSEATPASATVRVSLGDARFEMVITQARR